MKGLSRMYQAIVFLPLAGFLIAGIFGRLIGPRPVGAYHDEPALRRGGALPG